MNKLTKRELLAMIRSDKNQVPVAAHFSLDIYPFGNKDEVIDANQQIQLEPVHYSKDVRYVIHQIKVAAQLLKFERELAKARVAHCRKIAQVYGRLMDTLSGQYSDAYLSKPSNTFEMKQTMVHIRALSNELALREDKDESIFDAERIQNELEQIMELDDGGDDRQHMCDSTV